jgi:hypothetical protein
MRLIALLPALLALVACSSGGGNGEHRLSARQTQRTTADVAEKAFPVTARVLGAHKVGAHAEWSECLQGLSWKYAGNGAVVAPGGHVQARLQAVRAALLRAGFTDELTTESQVGVGRDGISFTVFRPADARGVWTVLFGSGCNGYSDEDQKVIDADTGNDFAGLEP